MRRLLSPRWVVVHVGMVALVAAFLALGWWQIHRAMDGNFLSFGYAVEWPVFAAFVVFVWSVEVRKQLRASVGAEGGEGINESPAAAQQAPDVLPAPEQPVRRRRTRSEAAYDDSDDPQLAAYNHYLAWLNAHPGATPADYPGS